MSIEIIPVAGPQLLMEFIQFPFKLYKNNPYWVPRLFVDLKESLSLNNPSLNNENFKLLIAKQNGKTVGRIAVMINDRDINLLNDPKCRFSYYDIIDDLEVSRCLLDQATNWARAKKLTYLEGPIGMTNLDRAGMLTHGFDEIGTISSLYNAPYYQQHLISLGFKPHAQWREYRIRVPQDIPEKVKKFSSLIAERYQLELVQFKSQNEVIHYAKDLLDLMNKTHNTLYGYSPLEDEHFNYYIERYKALLHPDYVSVVLNKERQIVAFGIALPSMSKAFQKARGRLWPFGWWHIKNAIKNNNTIDLQLIGVLPEYQRKAVPAMIFNEFTQAFYRNGIKWIESNPELESNKGIHALMQKYEHRVHKKRSSFIKYI